MNLVSDCTNASWRRRHFLRRAKLAAIIPERAERVSCGQHGILHSCLSNIFLALTRCSRRLPTANVPRGVSKIMLVAVILSTSSIAGSAQKIQRSIAGPLDTGIPIPAASGTLHQLDPQATVEIRAHQEAVGGIPWNNMQAAGTISFAQDPTAYPAKLTNSGTHAFRLDVETPRGEESTRIDGHVGMVRDSENKPLVIPPGTAALGLFPFELARTALLLNAETSLRDDGLISINGTTFHRITHEFATFGRNPSTKAQQTEVIDLYFDPASHLLIKSVCQVLPYKGRPANLTSVVTYSDYRLVGSSRIPFHYVETLEGELYRTLQLTTVQLGSTLSSNYFHF